MTRATCIEKIRDKHNNITGYVLQDFTGAVETFTPQDLRTMMACKQIELSNLKLSSNHRIIDKNADEMQVEHRGKFNAIDLIQKINYLSGGRLLTAQGRSAAKLSTSYLNRMKLLKHKNLWKDLDKYDDLLIVVNLAHLNNTQYDITAINRDRALHDYSFEIVGVQNIDTRPIKRFKEVEQLINYRVNLMELDLYTYSDIGRRELDVMDDTLFEENGQWAVAMMFCYTLHETLLRKDAPGDVSVSEYRNDIYEHLLRRLKERPNVIAVQFIDTIFKRVFDRDRRNEIPGENIKDDVTIRHKNEIEKQRETVGDTFKKKNILNMFKR